jgi:hypothetical protein
MTSKERARTFGTVFMGAILAAVRWIFPWKARVLAAATVHLGGSYEDIAGMYGYHAAGLAAARWKT